MATETFVRVDSTVSDASFVTASSHFSCDSACAHLEERSEGTQMPHMPERPRLETGMQSCHRAAFEGNVEELEHLLKSCSLEAISGFDCHGLTALHIAAMRNHAECVSRLLAAGFDASVKSTSGWTALEEATCYKNAEALNTIVTWLHKGQNAKVESKLRALALVLKDMPDCAFQISWELTSPIVGVVLHKHLPRDTYTVYKSGGRLRIDGHLKGVDSTSNAILPQWKFGHFSILVDTETGRKGREPPMHVNHDRKTYTELDFLGEEGGEEKKEVDDALKMMASSYLRAPRVQRSRVKFTNFHFKPVSGWISGTLRERIDNMDTQVYEAQGELMAVTTAKTPLLLGPKCSFEEYCTKPLAPNVEATVPLNFSSGFNSHAADGSAAEGMNQAVSEQQAAAEPRDSETELCSLQVDPFNPFEPPGAQLASVGSGDSLPYSRHRTVECSGSSRHKLRGANVVRTVGHDGKVIRLRHAGKGRKMRARLWLGNKLPINQQQLLPLLDVIGTKNQYIRKVCNFMEKYGSMDLFPVRIQIPLILSMRMSMSIRNVCVWDDARSAKLAAGAPVSLKSRPPDQFFSVPQGYRLVTIEQRNKDMRDKDKLNRPSRKGRQQSSPSCQPGHSSCD